MQGSRSGCPLLQLGTSVKFARSSLWTSETPPYETPAAVTAARLMMNVLYCQSAVVPESITTQRPMPVPVHALFSSWIDTARGDGTPGILICSNWQNGFEQFWDPVGSPVVTVPPNAPTTPANAALFAGFGSVTSPLTATDAASVTFAFGSVTGGME